MKKTILAELNKVVKKTTYPFSFGQMIEHIKTRTSWSRQIACVVAAVSQITDALFDETGKLRKRIEILETGMEEAEERENRAYRNNRSNRGGRGMGF